MPYTIRKRNSKFCVYKLENGRPSGNTLGCHTTRRSARRQIVAIELSENEEKQN